MYSRNASGSLEMMNRQGCIKRRDVVIALSLLFISIVIFFIAVNNTTYVYDGLLNKDEHIAQHNGYSRISSLRHGDGTDGSMAASPAVDILDTSATVKTLSAMQSLRAAPALPSLAQSVTRSLMSSTMGTENDIHAAALAYEIRKSLQLYENPDEMNISAVARPQTEAVGVGFCFPNLYIAGFPKAGSSALYEQLIHHTHILGGIEKEWRYFENEIKLHQSLNQTMRDMVESYKKNYKWACLIQKKGHLTFERKAATYIMDGNPDLAWQVSPRGERAVAGTGLYDLPLFFSTLVPKAKYIFIESDPVKRATSDFFFSYYWDHNKKQASAADFDKYVTRQVTSYEQCFEKMPGCCCAYFPPEDVRPFLRLHISFYECHKARMSAFVDAENMYTVHGEANATSIPGVLEFLGLETQLATWTKGYHDNHNSHVPPGEAGLRMLTEFYTKHNAVDMLKETKSSSFEINDLIDYCEVAEHTQYIKNNMPHK